MRLQFDDCREARLDRLEDATHASTIRTAVRGCHECYVLWQRMSVDATREQELHERCLYRWCSLPKIVKEPHCRCRRLQRTRQLAEREKCRAFTILGNPR